MYVMLASITTELCDKLLEQQTLPKTHYKLLLLLA